MILFLAIKTYETDISKITIQDLIIHQIKHR